MQNWNMEYFIAFWNILFKHEVSGNHCSFEDLLKTDSLEATEYMFERLQQTHNTQAIRKELM